MQCLLFRLKYRTRDPNVPCFCITCKNLTMTLELGRMRTCRLPAFSALLMELSASLSTEVFMLPVVDSQGARRGLRYLYREWLAFKSHGERGECPSVRRAHRGFFSSVDAGAAVSLPSGR